MPEQFPQSSNRGSQDNPVLQPILENETFTFDACDGTRTMANAKDVFTGSVDRNGKDYSLCNPGPATSATPAHVYELVKNAKFKGMFQSLPFPLDAMCVTESQYIGFVEKYPHLLGKYGTYMSMFMLVKKDASLPAMQIIDGIENFDNVSVADAGWGSNCLFSNVLSFVSSYVWNSDDHHRVVVPQPRIS